MFVARAAAVGVERQLASAGDKVAVGNKSAALTFGTEAEVFELNQNGDRETVVDRDVVDVLVLDAGFCKRRCPGAHRARISQIDIAAELAFHRLTGAYDFYERPLERACDFRTHDDHRAAAVADHAAIEPMQR